MNNSIEWDIELINRYDLSGPRYTSYPTAIEFSQKFSADDLIDKARTTADKQSPLSLYFHVPFCTHVCYFCACNKVITGKKDKAVPYLASLHQEIESQSARFSENRMVDQLHLGGGTPTFISDEQLSSLFDKLNRHFELRKDNSRDFSIEIDPREADQSRVKFLAGLGFNRISLGVQDINPEVQKAVNRVQPIELSEEIIISARDNGVKSINTDLIYGLPKQSPDSFAKTLDKVIELSPDRLSIFNYAHMPDRFRPQRRINEVELPSPQDKLTILENTISQLTDAGYIYIGMDHFAKPDDELAIAQQQGQLHRNFQGYTTHSDCDLLAMGVSAISQIGDTYFQNHHDIANYEEMIGQSGHAINRGITLNNDDKIRRSVIGQLICHFELHPSVIEEKHNIQFYDYFKNELESLKPLEQDNLIAWKNGTLYVTPRGRLLIRNICMMFDAYQTAKSGRVFSKVI